MFSSIGRSTRLKGIKTSRLHEFLTEFSDVITDIRELLLPQEDTL
ncbi:hypothetical protein STZ1_40349 [Bacillus subtilis]